MNRKWFLVLSFLFILSLLSSGCAQSKSTGTATIQNTKEAGKKLTIVTSFFPMYVSAINVTKAIPDVEVINMTKPQTGCLHDYSLKPDDLKTLETADVFIVNGAGMEAFLDKVIKQHEKMKIVDASKGIELLKDEDGNVNPHVWVNVSNAILQVKNISRQLAAVDPGNAEKYKENADAYIRRLEELKEKMHKSLDGIGNKNIITFHEAFPYFAKEFGLNIAAVIEREPGTSPTPKELDETIQIVKETKTRALFAEPQYSGKAADTIANETGAKVYTLDPAVTGEADPNRYDEYIEIMEKNLEVLEKALK